MKTIEKADAWDLLHALGGIVKETDTTLTWVDGETGMSIKFTKGNESDIVLMIKDDNTADIGFLNK